MIKPGRELDKLVAEKVMGLEVVKRVWGKEKQYHGFSIGEPYYYDDQGEMILHNPLPAYSWDIKDAWEIINHMQCLVELTTNNPYGPTTPETEWMVTFQAEYEAHGESPAHAICLAALKAKGYNEAG